MPASGEKPVRRNELKEAANFAKGVMDSHDVKVRPIPSLIAPHASSHHPYPRPGGRAL